MRAHRTLPRPTDGKSPTTLGTTFRLAPPCSVCSAADVGQRPTWSPLATSCRVCRRPATLAHRHPEARRVSTRCQHLNERLAFNVCAELRSTRFSNVRLAKFRSNCQRATFIIGCESPNSSSLIVHNRPLSIRWSTTVVVEISIRNDEGRAMWSPPPGAQLLPGAVAQRFLRTPAEPHSRAP